MVPGNGVRRDKLSKAFHPNKPKIVINRNVISTGPVGSRVGISILIYLWNFYRPATILIAHCLKFAN